MTKLFETGFNLSDLTGNQPHVFAIIPYIYYSDSSYTVNTVCRDCENIRHCIRGIVPKGIIKNSYQVPLFPKRGELRQAYPFRLPDIYIPKVWFLFFFGAIPHLHFFKLVNVGAVKRACHNIQHRRNDSVFKFVLVFFFEGKQAKDSL